MKKRYLSVGVLAVGLWCAGIVDAVPVSLNTWTDESYTPTAPGQWNVSIDGSTVTQALNNDPTVFYSDFSAINTNLVGKITPSGNDNDFIGFVLGFNPGDATNIAADYLLVDWKGGTQNFDFPNSTSPSPGGIAPVGLAVSRVTGVPDADEFWQHDNLSGTPLGSELVELARATNLGSTGWVLGTEYEFTFNFTATNLQVFVDGTLEIDIAGSFNDGRLGFYNFSEGNVVYSGFTVDLVEPGGNGIPEPVTGALGLMGLGVLSAATRRRVA